VTYYILAANLNDATQWCHFNGVSRAESVYVGQSWYLPTRVFAETDRIVRTARHQEHPALPELERALADVLAASKLTETVHGSLVRREG
jgi:hypothetical protein